MPVYISRINDLLYEMNNKGRRKKYTIESVAKAVGVSRQAVYTWASPNGVDRKPSAEHMIKLCQFFGVTEAELWQLVEAPPSQDETEGKRVLAGKG